jgi:DNA-binding XRE family transcriptional regulator
VATEAEQYPATAMIPPMFNLCMKNSTRMKSAAVRFRSFRRSKKMSQRMLGLLLGVSRRSVYNIEQGIHEPSIRHLDEFDALVERHSHEAHTKS